MRKKWIENLAKFVHLGLTGVCEELWSGCCQIQHEPGGVSNQPVKLIRGPVNGLFWFIRGGIMTK